MVGNPFQQGLSVKVSGDASGATGAISSLTGALGGLKGAALAAGGALAIGLAAKGLASSVRAAGDFNAAMQESIAIMGDVSDAMRKDMNEAARDVATQTTFSAEQAAESYFFLASAGLDAKESIEALPEVARFAQAGMFDMAQATDLLTDSASALGLEIREYNMLADTLVKANTLANASVEQFATALKTRAAAEMRNANVELSEGVSILAALADQGIKAERAGQVFQRTLLVLQEAAKDNSETLNELGIEIFDASGEMRSMIGIIGQLTEATEDMSTQERNAALEALGFSRRTREGIVALLGKTEQLKEYRKELENAGGTTEEVADKQLQSFNSQVSLLKSEIEDLKISLGTALLPALIDIVKGLNDGIQAAKQFISEIKNLIAASQQFAEEFVSPGFVGGRTTQQAAAASGATATGRGRAQTVRFESDGTPFMDLIAQIANQSVKDREERSDRFGPGPRGAR